MNKQTLMQIVNVGLAKNTTGVSLATKRNGQWEKTSCDDFAVRIKQCALGLYELGVRKGDRVALHAENSAEWVIADQAILSLGAINVPIYTTQPGDQIQYILENSEATVYIVSREKLFDGFRPYIDQVSSLKATIGFLGVYHPDMLVWGHVLDKGRARLAEEPELFSSLVAQVQPDDLASFIYTSGTTGKPKGVMLTHRNLVSNVFGALERMAFDPDADRGHNLLSYLPLSHVFERIITYLSLHIGYPIYFVEDFTEIMDDLQTVKPVHFSSVPRLLEKVYLGIKAKAGTLSGPKKKLMQWAIGIAEAYDVAHPPTGAARLKHKAADALVYKKLRALFGGNLKAITSGGAALSGRVMNFINAIGIFCGQGYGMTESSPVITSYEKDRLKAGSVGRPIRDVEIKIIEESGYRPGEGEVWARGPNVMKGYYKMPEQTQATITEDGWLKTGDIGYLDKEGFLFITDRKKELMKLSTGKYVAPQPIEVGLSTCRFIEQAVVIGNRQKFCSALLVPDAAAFKAYFKDKGMPLPDDLNTHADVRACIQKEVDEVNANLPHWERVKTFTLLETPFSVEGGEMTPTLKIKRRIIQEKYETEIEAMYEG